MLVATIDVIIVQMEVISKTIAWPVRQYLLNLVVGTSCYEVALPLPNSLAC